MQAGAIGVKRPGASQQELELLFRQLAAASRARLPFSEVLVILRQEGERGRYGRLLAILGRELEQGKPLSDALAATAVFAPQTVAFVRGAEGTPALSEVLQVLADDYGRGAVAGRAMANALYWPLTLAALLVFVIMILMIFVVPAFKEIYRSFGADLPAPTLALMTLSDWFVRLWPVLFVVAILLALAAFFRGKAPPVVGETYDWVRLRVPLVGAFREKLFQLRSVALLAVAAGADRDFAAAALAHLDGTADNRRLASWVGPLARRVAGSGELLPAVRETPEVPRRVAAILELGARTGDAAAARAQVAAWCDAEMELGLPRFQTNFLALSYAVLGTLIAFVVIGLYLPIFMMGAAV